MVGPVHLRTLDLQYPGISPLGVMWVEDSPSGRMTRAGWMESPTERPRGHEVQGKGPEPTDLRRHRMDSGREQKMSISKEFRFTEVFKLQYILLVPNT